MFFIFLFLKYPLISLDVFIFIVSSYLILILNDLHLTTRGQRNHNHKYCNHATAHIFLNFNLRINNTDVFLKISIIRGILRCMTHPCFLVCAHA